MLQAQRIPIGDCFIPGDMGMERSKQTFAKDGAKLSYSGTWPLSVPGQQRIQGSIVCFLTQKPLAPHICIKPDTHAWHIAPVNL